MPSDLPCRPLDTSQKEQYTYLSVYRYLPAATVMPCHGACMDGWMDWHGLITIELAGVLSDRPRGGCGQLSRMVLKVATVT